MVPKSSSSRWVIAGVSVAAVATAAYIIYRQFCLPSASKTVQDKSAARKKRKRPLQSNSSSSVRASSDNAKPELKQQEGQNAKEREILEMGEVKKEAIKNKSKSMTVDCDSPLEDILQEPPEARQRLFMEMMMRGEFLIQQGNLEKAIDYLVKGMSMIPNPGEVLLSLEHVLPESVFKALLERLQKEGKKRVREYFDGISAEHPQLSFGSKECKNEVTGHIAERWFMRAGKQFSKGEVVFEETADIMIRSITSQPHCERCLCNIIGEVVKCSKCGEGVYCSSACQLSSATETHCYVCRGENEGAAEAYEKLLHYCRETKTSAGLLLFKYISLLLNAELQNISSGALTGNSTGPFAHYDHLRPAFRQPNERDLKEAKLLKEIFTRSNPNMQDFLTDDIYAAMKYTLLFNCYGFNDGSDASNSHSCEEYVRNISSSAAADHIGLYHIASHMEHSCSPNAQISLLENNSVTVTALSDISKNDLVSVAYSPSICNVHEKEARQVNLLSQFGIVCDCIKCH